MTSIPPPAPAHIDQPTEKLGDANNAGYQPPAAPTATMFEVRYKPAGNPKLIKLAPTQYFSTDVVDSTLMACPECKEDVLTTVKPEIGPQTICASVAGGLCFLPLACILCFVDSIKDKVHYCHKCGFRFGKLNYISVRPNAANK
ncbi:hypothetical protein LPJ73_005956 [Coemansia sp. RSA 2703]|nr:hypothetical protein LPJ73_005956 [Coemansia sp. RSA 2703]KAJ2367136.1 hypothetical protein IW150_005747 [Coemansia sp. RSA 2607]KAJ2388392.1 hypothetical protein GGI05_003799 [Coemansia sp. RSA 2603]